MVNLRDVFYEAGTILLLKGGKYRVKADVELNRINGIWHDKAGHQADLINLCHKID